MTIKRIIGIILIITLVLGTFITGFVMYGWWMFLVIALALLVSLLFKFIEYLMK